MEKGTWTLIMPSSLATSQSRYRWAGCAWEEVWDVGGEEKGEVVAEAEDNVGSVGP
jgi:hypothetical protein